MAKISEKDALSAAKRLIAAKGQPQTSTKVRKAAAPKPLRHTATLKAEVSSLTSILAGRSTHVSHLQADHDRLKTELAAARASAAQYGILLRIADSKKAASIQEKIASSREIRKVRKELRGEGEGGAVEMEGLGKDLQAGEELCLWQHGRIEELERAVKVERARRDEASRDKKEIKERNRSI